MHEEAAHGKLAAWDDRFCSLGGGRGPLKLTRVEKIAFKSKPHTSHDISKKDTSKQFAVNVYMWRSEVILGCRSSGVVHLVF